MLKGYRPDSGHQRDCEINEQTFVRSLFCVVLCHCIDSVKGGWQQLEETVNFLLMHCKKVCPISHCTMTILCHLLSLFTCFDSQRSLDIFRIQVGISYWYFLRDIYEDLIWRLVDLSSEENIFVSQPCRDNTLYLLRLVDEMLISEIDHKVPVSNIPQKFRVVH